MLVGFEGEILKVYKDPVGLPTFGVGHLVKHEERDEFPVGKKITKATSREYFRKDLASFEDCVNNAVTVPITQNQFDALVSLAFNIGQANFKRSSVLKNLNNRQFDKAADAFLAWNKSKGRVLPGLVRRRKTERALFLKPDSAADPQTTAQPFIQTDEQANPETTQPPTLWERLTGWVDAITAKFTKAQEVSDKLAPISNSSRFAVITTKAGGWALMAFGFFSEYWPYILGGTALIVAGVWYLSRSKDRAQARS